MKSERQQISPKAGITVVTPFKLYILFFLESTVQSIYDSVFKFYFFTNIFFSNNTISSKSSSLLLSSSFKALKLKFPS